MFKKSPYLMTWLLYIVVMVSLVLILIMADGENTSITLMGIGISLKPAIFIYVISLIPMSVLLFFQSRKRTIVKPPGVMLGVGVGTFFAAAVLLIAAVLVFIADMELGTAFYKPGPPLTVGTKNNNSLLATLMLAFAVPIAIAGLTAKIASNHFERRESS